MSSEALGVSVAPSVLHSCCIQEGKQQALDDVTRFKAQICVATSIMRFLIDNFGVTNLFSRANYENWIFAFRYPPSDLVTRNTSLGLEEEWLQLEATKWGIPLMQGHELRLESSSSRERREREESDQEREREGDQDGDSCLNLSLEQLKCVNKYAESTKSLSFLPIVHERQTARMKSRSEWFLTPKQEKEKEQACVNEANVSLVRRSSSKRKSSQEKESSKIEKKNSIRETKTQEEENETKIAVKGKQKVKQKDSAQVCLH